MFIKTMKAPGGVRGTTNFPRFFAFLVFFAVSASPQELASEIILDKAFYARGDTVVAGLHVVIPEKYHLYSNPLGPGIGKPAIIRVQSGGGVRWLALFKSTPKRFNPDIGGWVWAYEKEAYFFLKGTVDSSAPDVVDATLFLTGLVCYTSCVPVNTANNFKIKISGKTAGGSFDASPVVRSFLSNVEPMNFEINPNTEMRGVESGALGMLSLSNLPGIAPEKRNNWEYEPVEKKISMNFLLALLFGFIAGIILNMMPCVLPVLGIKILSFAKAGGATRKTVIARSLVFSGGIMTVFMVLAALASFAHLSWGQQFQSPWFLIALIVLTVVFALGLFDVYILVPPKIGNWERKSGNGFAGEFLRGIFATLLATPCSGPFLGATLAWTLTQSTPVIFLVFASIGAGMAFPYVLLSASKTLVHSIPKPGKWMEDFKHLMGILLLGAAVYFLLGLPKDMVVSVVGFCIGIVFAVVFFFRFAPFGSSLSRYAVAFVAALIFASLGYYLAFGVIYKKTASQAELAAAHNEVEWKEFSPNLLLDAHAKGRHVIVDFTANWCLNCQYNMITVLSSKEVSEMIRLKNILALKADLTLANAPAESLLHFLGSRSVPFFAVFSGDDPYHPIIMRDILNKSAVMKALRGLPEK
jgi:thiol:disulfide interchange protein